MASGGGDRAQLISKFSGNDPLTQFQFLAGPLLAPAPGHEPSQGGQEGSPDTGEAGGAAAGSAIGVTCPGGRAPESPRRRARARAQLNRTNLFTPVSPKFSIPHTAWDTGRATPSVSPSLPAWKYRSTHLANVEGSSDIHQEGNQLNGRRGQVSVRSLGHSPCD